jgi:hypothetical protein
VEVLRFIFPSKLNRNLYILKKKGATMVPGVASAIISGGATLDTAMHGQV